ncbi:MAG: hypothetical protein QM790_17510 [Nibricoccus sp.]
MPHQQFLTALSSSGIAALIQQAMRRVIYAAPGIQIAVAKALAELAAGTLRPIVNVNVDFDERVLRMGYGTLEAVEVLRAAGIEPTHSPGFRSGILIVDDRGWVFTPTALYLEQEPQSIETPNALELGEEQVSALALRLSPEVREECIESAITPQIAAEISAIPLELAAEPIPLAHFDYVKQAISDAPPVKFDVVRQVRVFEPYIQYVELSLTGAAVQRHRIRIPKELQTLGQSKDLEGKLKTTFDLIERGSSLSSKALEEELSDIRRRLTPSLGKDHGRVILKNAKPRLAERLTRLRAMLEAHQAKVESELQNKIDDSKKQITNYYLPLVIENPPDALVGSLIRVTDEDARVWVEEILASVFPTAGDLLSKMTLEVRFKDVTFETLNRPDFMASVETAFPKVDWEKAYREFKAAGEEQPTLEN